LQPTVHFSSRLLLARLSPSLSLCFFFPSSGDHRDLHSFPTRRSSDLPVQPALGVFLGIARSAQPARGVVADDVGDRPANVDQPLDRKSTRLNSSHVKISYAVFCLKKKKKTKHSRAARTHNTRECCERR